jgi:hypothetical protein
VYCGLRVAALVGALLTIGVFPAPAVAGTCGAGTYAYAGIGTGAIVSRVAATIEPTAAPAVRDGHVAAWVGVGGLGEGLHGTDAWIQIGLSAFPGDTASRIYYEVAQPGRKPVYRELRSGVRVGEAHRFAVIEVAGRHGWWRVWLDDSPVSAPIYVPGSHVRWTAQALGESWNGNTTGTCNDYSYRFGAVSVGTTGAHRSASSFLSELYDDPNYLVIRTSPSSFLASSRP